MKAQVILGANFGDEGKGLFTDFLASRVRDEGKPCVVVRFNGGANAGHTVDTGEFRHVFGHFGSGTFAGARTHLSQHFVVNPVLFRREWDQIAGLKSPNRIWQLSNRVSIDPRAIVTHPYDMILNQCVEEKRGVHRHGSCGVGINETVTRQDYCGFSLHDLCSSEEWKAVVGLTLGYQLKKDYFWGRAEILGVREEFDKKTRLYDWDMKFKQDFEFLRQRIKLVPDGYVKQYGEVIFEGAQGLALDEINGEFPYVTRSRTGLTNVREICLEAGIDALDVYYATRTYLTRHGAGPFPEREVTVPYEVWDPTNVPNNWQGSLRDAPLDVESMVYRIDRDIVHFSAGSLIDVNSKIALSHCDLYAAPHEVAYAIESEAEIDVALHSWGPRRDNVRVVPRASAGYMDVQSNVPETTA